MMTFPAFYHPDRVGMMYVPDTLSAVLAGTQARIASSSSDFYRTALLLVDTQVDFIHTDGALSVPGAIEDTRRTIEWIFSNLGQITTIYASLDSHIPLQIFSPAWWTNADGQHPAPYTVITLDEVEAGAWQPLYDVEWSRQYVRALENNARKQLMIWPYHTLIGTPGHSITPALYEAIAYHTAARQSQPNFISKGTIAKTENYSLFEPEVKIDELPHGGLNIALLDEIADYDRIFIAGQAKSHCVLESVASLMRHFAGRPGGVNKVYLLEDAMSSVVHPEIDFEAMAVRAFHQFTDIGLRIVRTSERLD